MVDTSELFRARIDVDECRARLRNVEERVALRGNLAESAADEEDEIGPPHALDQLGIGPDTKIASIVRMQWIEEREAPVTRHDGQLERLRELSQSLARFFRPAA